MTANRGPKRTNRRRAAEAGDRYTQAQQTRRERQEALFDVSPDEDWEDGCGCGPDESAAAALQDLLTTDGTDGLIAALARCSSALSTCGGSHYSPHSVHSQMLTVDWAIKPLLYSIGRLDATGAVVWTPPLLDGDEHAAVLAAYRTVQEAAELSYRWLEPY